MSQGHFSREKVDCDLENKGRLRKCSHIPEKSLVSQKRDDKTKLQGPTSCLLHSLPSVPILHPHALSHPPSFSQMTAGKLPARRKLSRLSLPSDQPLSFFHSSSPLPFPHPQVSPKHHILHSANHRFPFS